MSGAAAEKARVWLERKELLAAQLAAESPHVSTLQALRAWQAARLASTYADLRSDARHRAAMDFFLSDIYGTHDVTPRDADLRRAWRPMQKTLSTPAMEILCDALELELLTLELDADVAKALGATPIDALSYAAAYRTAGRAAERERQIELIVDLARRLSQVVRHAWIGRLLRLARAPAEAAGLGVLQSFLERGFEAFRQLGDASQFISVIDSRERALMSQLFANTGGVDVGRR